MFVDLFGGSGVVGLNTKAEYHIYNDIVPYIGGILDGIREIKNTDEFITGVLDIQIRNYNLSKTNKEGFEALRNHYNNGNKEWYNLYLLMCYSFNNQYRFNAKHEYNSSFGKHKSCFSEITKGKLLEAKQRLDDMEIIFTSENFTDFDFSDFDGNDFVYFDPPYANSVGNYNDGKRGFEGWTSVHENDMRNLLIKLDNQGVRWALSNNFATNNSLEQWCKDNNFGFWKIKNTYSNSSYQKKERQTETKEVLIANY